jgi:TonB family protein
MKLSTAWMISLSIHILAITVFYYKIKQPVVAMNTQMSEETVEFNLGIAVGQIESLLVNKSNAKEQPKSKKGAVVSTATPAIDKVQKKTRSTPVKNVIHERPKKKQVKSSSVKVPNIVTKKSQQYLIEQDTATVETEIKKQKNRLAVKNISTVKVDVLNAQAVGVKAVNGNQSHDSQRSVKQVSPQNSKLSTGGKASLTKAQNTQVASYISGLQRKVANSANKIYPKKAKRRNQQAVVKVGFRLRKDGTIEDVQLIHKSEFPALNKAAIKAVKRVKKYKPLPEGINNYFIIPINFKMT